MLAAEVGQFAGRNSGVYREALAGRIADVCVGCGLLDWVWVFGRKQERTATFTTEFAKVVE
jgi:hypothetical protein